MSALEIDVDFWPMAKSVVAINNLGIRRDCAAATKLIGRFTGSPL